MISFTVPRNAFGRAAEMSFLLLKNHESCLISKIKQHVDNGNLSCQKPASGNAYFTAGRL